MFDKQELPGSHLALRSPTRQLALAFVLIRSCFLSLPRSSLHDLRFYIYISHLYSAPYQLVSRF